MKRFLASSSFKITRSKHSKSDFHSIEASVFEVISYQNLQYSLHSYNHEAFQKVRHKLDSIDQPYVDKIHSR